MICPNCGIFSELVQCEQPSISCQKCNNLFHSNCVSSPLESLGSPSNNPSWIFNACLVKPKPSHTEDKLNLILSELQSIKSYQFKSDELLKNISTSVDALNDKVSHQ